MAFSPYIRWCVRAHRPAVAHAPVHVPTLTGMQVVAHAPCPRSHALSLSFARFIDRWCPFLKFLQPWIHTFFHVCVYMSLPINLSMNVHLACLKISSSSSALFITNCPMLCCSAPCLNSTRFFASVISSSSNMAHICENMRPGLPCQNTEQSVGCLSLVTWPWISRCGLHFQLRMRFRQEGACTACGCVGSGTMFFSSELPERAPLKWGDFKTRLPLLSGGVLRHIAPLKWAGFGDV